MGQPTEIKGTLSKSGLCNSSIISGHTCWYATWDTHYGSPPYSQGTLVARGSPTPVLQAAGAAACSPLALCHVGCGRGTDLPTTWAAQTECRPPGPSLTTWQQEPTGQMLTAYGTYAAHMWSTDHMLRPPETPVVHKPPFGQPCSKLRSQGCIGIQVSSAQ